MLRNLKLRVRGLFRRDDIDDELKLHLEQLADELSMANYQIGLNLLVFEVLIRLPGCAISSSYSFI